MTKIKTEMEEQSGVKIDYIKESLNYVQVCILWYFNSEFLSNQNVR